jgi:hypothetical protein
MTRAISFTEQSMLLTCQAQWDFNYGGYLAGTTLRPKSVPIRLQEGRAWGAGVAAFHAAGEDQLDVGIIALVKALDDEAKKLQEAGFYDADAHREMASKLRALLEQYAGEEDEKATQISGLSRLEHELLVPLPSRSGKGDSSKYRLQVFFDGVAPEDGRNWLVEYKLREKLSPLELIANSRQIRYYAWAWQREFGQPVVGVIVDERLNAQPKPARWVKPKKKDEGIAVDPDQAAELGAPYSDKEREIYIGDEGKLARRTVSHAKEQLTTPESYEAACEKAGVEHEPETLEEIRSRRWSQRHAIFLTPEEIEESGRELVSLGRQVARVDSGEVYPVRNVKPQNCNGCRFKAICNNPHDTELVDSLFDRKPAKRDLPNKEAIPA